MTVGTTPSLAVSRLVRRMHLLGDFLAVAREGGIRQAAKKTHLTQSALTRRIQDLEQELGLELFERTARGMALSAYGRALLHHAQLIELNCVHAVGELNDLIDGSAGELRIAAGPAWANSLVPDAIVALQRRFPRVRVRVSSRMNDVTLPLLAAGDLDLVVGGLPEPDQRHPELRYEPAMEIEHLVFGGDRHPLSHATGVVARDLVRFPWIALADAVSGPRMLGRYFAAHRMTPPPAAIETMSVQTGIRLLQSGSYLMLLPSTLLPLANEFRIAPLQLRRHVGSYEAGLMYRESTLRLRAFSAFRDMLLDQAAKMF